MHKILQTILSERKKDLQIRKNTRLRQALLNTKGVGIIGELKLASPTESKIATRSLVAQKIKDYRDAGVCALSIITEPHFFKGDITFIPKIKKFTNIPILQKDFIIDEKQIYEAAFMGADAILLIVRILKGSSLKRFVALSRKIGIEPIVEVAREEDIRAAIDSGTDIIAVNARDLDTFQVDVARACALLKKIPNSCITLGFSGIKTAKDMDMYKKAGVKGVLIGTSLMKTDNVSRFLRDLVYEKN